MTVYADEIFAINVLANELLMYGYCIMRGVKPRHGRMAAASAVCGVYAVAEALWELPRVLRCGVFLMMMYIIFGRRDMLRHAAGAAFLAFAVEGLTLAAVAATGGYAGAARDGITVFASEPVTAALYILSYPAYIMIRRLQKRERKYRRLRLGYRGRVIDVKVLYDSGNLLRYHNKPVIMLAWEAAAPLFDFTSFTELKNGAEAYVMYETVSGAGTLPVIEPEYSSLDGCEVDTAAAVVERKFKGKYCGIAGDI